MVSLSNLFGGAQYYSLSSDLQLSAGAKRVISISASAGLKVRLPDRGDFPTSGYKYWILNVGSNPFDIWPATGDQVGGNFSGITAQASDNSFNGDVAYWGPGTQIQTSAFSNGANNGTFTVVQRSCNGLKMIVSGGTLVDESPGGSVTITGQKIITVPANKYAWAVLCKNALRNQREWAAVIKSFGPVTFHMVGGTPVTLPQNPCLLPTSMNFRVAGTLLTGDHSYPGGTLPQPPGGILPDMVYIGGNTWYSDVWSGLQHWQAQLLISCPAVTGTLTLSYSDAGGNWIGDYTGNATVNGEGTYDGPEVGVTPLTQTISQVSTGGGGGGGGGGSGGHTSICTTITVPNPPPPPPPYDGSPPLDLSGCANTKTVTIASGTGPGAIWNGVWTVTKQSNAYYRKIIDTLHYIDIRGYASGLGPGGFSWQVVCVDLTSVVFKRFGNNTAGSCPPNATYSCFLMPADNADCTTGGPLTCIVSA